MINMTIENMEMDCLKWHFNNGKMFIKIAKDMNTYPQLYISFTKETDINLQKFSRVLSLFKIDDKTFEIWLDIESKNVPHYFFNGMMEKALFVNKEKNVCIIKSHDGVKDWSLLGIKKDK